MYYKLGNNSTKGAVYNTAHVHKYYVSYKLQRYDLSVFIKVPTTHRIAMTHTHMCILATSQRLCGDYSYQLLIYKSYILTTPKKVPKNIRRRRVSLQLSNGSHFDGV